MSRHLRRSALLLLALVGLLAVGLVSRSDAQYEIYEARDLRIVRFHPNGNVDCSKWCGLLESCC